MRRSVNDAQKQRSRFESFVYNRRYKVSRVLGVGINDSDYQISYIDSDGQQIVCPIYTKWRGMLGRCHSRNASNWSPTYTDVSVCEQWLRFSVFREWMIRQDWFGKHLDKDIAISGSKVYSPETCIFVNPQVNGLLVDSKRKRGKYLAGVRFHKRDKRFTAQLSIYNKQKILGTFDTELEAHLAYLKAKAAYAREVAIEQEPFLRSCLERIAGEIERGEYYV